MIIFGVFAIAFLIASRHAKGAMWLVFQLCFVLCMYMAFGAVFKEIVAGASKLSARVQASI